MSFEQSVSDEKFWRTPELLERLVSLLDPMSALRLIQSSVVDKEILQKSLSSKAWSKLIRQSSYGEEEGGLLHKEDAMDLVRILHFLEPEEPGVFLLPLLDLICESGPSYQGLFPTCQVQMTCPSHPDPHSITDEAFLLLELVEGAFGTAEQSVKSISVWELQEPLLSALSARVTRQRETLTSVQFFYVVCSSSVEALITLLEAEQVSVKFLDLGGALGEEALHILARSLQGKPDVMLGWVYISKLDLVEGRRADIKDIWESTGQAIGVFNTENGVFNSDKGSVLVQKSKHDWEQAWRRLKQISDMAEDEFNAECDQNIWDPGEEGEDEEGEEEEGEDQEHDEVDG